MLNAILLSIGSGCRTMTPIAVICWACYLRYLPATGWAAWTGTLPAVILFSICAVGEWGVDILPQTPSRRDFPLAATRLVMGVLVASLMWHMMQEPWLGGVVLGIVGATIGTRGGYHLRVWAAKKVGRDWPVGLTESMLVLAISVWMMKDMHDGLALMSAARHQP